MDELNRTILDRVMAWLHLAEFVPNVARALVMWAGCMAILVVIDLRAGVSLAPYASRSFAVDLTYRVLHSLYSVAVYVPISMATREAYPALNLQLLNTASLWIGIPAYLVIFDFIGYWVHRVQHSRFWWRFHRVHHSAEQMTFASSFRNHPIDQMLAHAMTLFPLLLLGAPPVAWLPYSFALVFVDAMHHANLPWRFGVVRKVFVSPIFHAAHHAVEPQLRDRNFGGIFSCWDFMFGTAADIDQRPARTGVEGWRVRESWLAHFVSPFRSSSVVVPPRERDETR